MLPCIYCSLVVIRLALASMAMRVGNLVRHASILDDAELPEEFLDELNLKLTDAYWSKIESWYRTVVDGVVYEARCAGSQTGPEQYLCDYTVIDFATGEVMFSALHSESRWLDGDKRTAGIYEHAVESCNQNPKICLSSAWEEGHLVTLGGLVLGYTFESKPQKRER